MNTTKRTQIPNFVPHFLLQSRTYYYFLTDLAGAVSFANDFFVSQLHPKNASLIGQPFSIISAHYQVFMMKNAFEECLKNPQKTVQIVIQKGDFFVDKSQEICFELSLVKDADGFPIGVQGIGHERELGDDALEQMRLKELRNYFEEMNVLRTQYSAILDCTTDVYALIDKSFKVLAVNKIAQFYTQKFYPREIRAGDNILDFVLPNTPFDFVDNFNKALQGEYIELEREIAFRENAKYWFYVKYTPVYNFDNQLIGVAFTATNINAQKRSEAKLKANSVFLDTLISHLPGYVYRVANDRDYTPLYISEGVKAITGYAQAEYLVSRTISCGKEMHVQDVERVWDIVQNALNQGISFECQYRIITKQNQIKWVWERGRGISDEKGNLMYIEGFVTDITDRKILEDNLLKEKQRLNNIIEGTNAGTWEWNIETGEIIFNERWANLIGYTLEEFGQTTIETWFAYAHQEDLVKSEELIALHLAGKIPDYECEIRLKHKNGQWVWVLDKGKVVSWTTEGKPLLMSGIAQDITQRKHVQEAIRLIEGRSDMIFKTMQEGMVIQDMKGVILSCNDSAERILGLSYQQMIGRASIDERWQAIREDYRPFPGEEHPAMITLKTGEPQHNVMMGVRKPDGIITWISINSQLLLHPDTQEPYGVFATFYDITDRKNAELTIQRQNKALTASEEELRQNLHELNHFQSRLIRQNQRLEALTTALDHSAIVSMTNTEGKILRVNDKFCEISKYSREELMGKNHRIISSGYHSTEFWEEMWQTIKGGNVWYGEVKNRAKDGTFYWVYTINNPIFDHENQIVQFLSVRFDITARKEAEERIVKQNQALREIAFHQSHTLRRPISSILGLMHLLKYEKERLHQHEDFAQLYEYLHYIELAVQETDAVIHQIVEKTMDAE